MSKLTYKEYMAQYKVKQLKHYVADFDRPMDVQEERKAAKMLFEINEIDTSHLGSYDATKKKVADELNKQGENHE